MRTPAESAQSTKCASVDPAAQRQYWRERQMQQEQEVLQEDKMFFGNTVDFGGATQRVEYEFDEGCTFYSIMTSPVYEKLCSQGARQRYVPLTQRIDVTLATGDRVPATGSVVVDITMDSRAGPVTFANMEILLVPGKPDTPLLIGKRDIESKMKFTSALRARIEKQERQTQDQLRASFGQPEPGVVTGRRATQTVNGDEAESTTMNLDGHEAEHDREQWHPPMVCPRVTAQEGSRAEVTDRQERMEQLRELVRRAQEAGASASFVNEVKARLREAWAECFRTTLGNDPPAKLKPLQVHFIDNVKLPRGYQTRRYSPEHCAAMDEEIADMVRVGVIQVAEEAIVVSCVHMVKKPNGRGWRMTVDYRRINACIQPESWPFPRIDDLIHRVRGATVFGCLDLLKGYWQVPLHENARKFLAFQTHDGVYEWTRVPMGTRNAAAHFQRVMTEMFRAAGLLNKGVVIYLDDILVYAESEYDLLRLWAGLQYVEEPWHLRWARKVYLIR